MRTVVKYSKNGEVVATYKSVWRAAEANYFTNSAMHRWCSGQLKRKIAPDGYIYRFAK